MPANRAPNVDIPLQDAKGNTNQQWWRFWSSLAAQFSGKDAAAMPVDVPGLLSITNAQAKPQPLTEAAVVEAAKQLIAAIPRPAGRDQATADLALMAQMRHPAVNRETGALDLATMAMARIRPAQTSQGAQIIVCTQATFPTLAAGVATFVYVSDFAHWIYWNGTAATFADGGSDYYTVAAAAPSAVGWHAVDGSTVNYLNADGTLTSKTLKNVAGTPGYLKVGAGADTLNAPVAPGFTGTLATPTGSVASAFTGSPQAFTAVPVAAVGIVNAFTGPDPYTPAGIVASSFAGTPASPNGIVSATGEPENFYSALWFRL